MYYQHFGLSGPPFQFTPAPHLLYLSKSHKEALAALEWGLKEPSGFTLLIGEAGTGKTTLICSLLAREHRWVRIAYIPNPKLSFEELMKVILDQLPATISEPGKLGLVKALNDVLSRLTENERIAIIIDEAQDLSDEALEELRLLSNFERYERKLLQIILVGQPELARRLSEPQLRQLNQRIGARARLDPLEESEVYEYIEHRLVANNGSSDKIFTPAALRLIARQSAGIPRQVNLLCHNAMLAAYAAGAKQVDAKAVRAILTECSQALVGNVKPGRTKSRLGAVAPRLKHSAGIAAIFLGLAFSAGLTTYVWQKHQADAAFVKPSEISVAEKERPPIKSVDTDRPQAAQIKSDNHPAATLILVPDDPSLSPSAQNVKDNEALESSSETRKHGSETSLTNKRKVIIRRGDTLASIAQRYLGSKDELQKLLEANPQIKNADVIYPGDTIYLPNTPSAAR